MRNQVTLTLPDAIYRRAQKIAQSTRRDVADVLAEVITQTMQPFPVHEKREEMLREIVAYKTLHPQLVRQYLGEYVAIHNGQLVDHDPDPIALLKRVRQQYPGEVVLRRRVEEEPEIAILVRSPRTALD